MGVTASEYHEQQTEEFITKAHQHSDIDAAILYATIASAHASLAVLHQLREP